MAGAGPRDSVPSAPVNDTLGIALFIAVAVIAVIGMIMAHRAARERCEALRALAGERGLAFEPGRQPPDSPHRLFDEFKRGHSRAVLNTMRGELELFGRPCACILGDFEYKVTSGSGKDRRTSTYRFSYTLLRIPWAIPTLALRRENVLDKVAGALGFDDIDFESEEFSRRFHVKCKDKKFAYDVIHPRMMEFLLSADVPELDFSGPWCCITRGSGRWAPQAFRDTLAFAGRYFGQWPDHLVAELETRVAAAGMTPS